MRAAILLALVLAPSAAAMDVLPTEIRLGAEEARILVRSADGSVRVDAEPSILAAPSAPEGDPGAFAPTPRVLEANATWHGLERILVVVLRRGDPSVAVEVTIEDASRTGISLEWPAERQRAPMPGVALVLAIVGALALGRARRGS